MPAMTDQERRALAEQLATARTADEAAQLLDEYTCALNAYAADLIRDRLADVFGDDTSNFVRRRLALTAYVIEENY